MPQDLFSTALAEHRALFAELHLLQPASERIGLRLADLLRGGGKIMFCGNGGSAADSQHLAS